MRNSHLLTLAAAALFSTGGAAIKASSLTASQISGLRSLIAAVALLALIPAARRRPTGRMLLVGTAQALTFILYVHANRLTTAASAIFLQGTAPLFVLLLSPWLLNERPQRRDLAFMACIFVGAVAFFVGLQTPLETAPNPAAGNVLAALSGLTYALTILGLRWVQVQAKGSEGNEKEGEAGAAIATVACGNGIAFLLSLPTALPLDRVETADWVLVIYLGVIQIGLAYVLLTRALERLRALEISLLLLLEPVLNVLLAWWIHAEVPGPWAIGGGIAILVTTAAKSWVDARDVSV